MRRGIIALAVLTVAGCGGSDESAIPQPIRDMQQALRAVHSYHMDADGSGSGGRAQIVADWSNGRARLHIVQRELTSDVIVVPGASYLRASRAQWLRANVPAKVAAKIAGRWVQVPLDKNTGGFIDKIDPDTVAHCAEVDLGTVHDLGVRSEDGARVRVLQLVGDVPGSYPGTVSLAAGGPAYPLRIVQNGPTKPGGSADPRCNSVDPASQTTRSVIRLSRFNAPVSIEPPAHPLTVEDIRAMAGGQPSGVA